MHIDSYQFGKIVIDGAAYNSDCLIFGGSVQADWWRKQGHLLTPEDLQPVISAGPSILVVGCGASGLMKVSENVNQILPEHGIELFAANTSKAVAKFNELAQKGQNVAAALHLTC
ncbi:MAG: Mth938-like domain-containing protein [Planctomycetota bacterium]|jgi:hypothetical protein